MTQTSIIDSGSDIRNLGESGSISPNTVLAQLTMSGVGTAADRSMDTCAICGSVGDQCRPSYRWDDYTVILAL